MHNRVGEGGDASNLRSFGMPSNDSSHHSISFFSGRNSIETLDCLSITELSMSQELKWPL